MRDRGEIDAMHAIQCNAFDWFNNSGYEPVLTRMMSKRKLPEPPDPFEPDPPNPKLKNL